MRPNSTIERTSNGKAREAPCFIIHRYGPCRFRPLNSTLDHYYSIASEVEQIMTYNKTTYTHATIALFCVRTAIVPLRIQRTI